MFVLALLLALLVYWLILHASHQRMREHVRAETQQLAGQTAQALALQMNTVVRKLDYFTQHLSWVWTLADDTRDFNDAVSVAINTLPPNALVQVAVADTKGQILYSNLDQTPPGASRPAVFITDREHFKVHLYADGPFFFISEPIKGRISQQWTIQFTRGIWQDGQFQGVMVLAVSAEYLATALKTIFPDSTDAASLVNNRGAYLTRSFYLTDVLGTTLPQTRPFIRHPEQSHGTYVLSADIDNVNRLYSWQRVDDYPVVILVGLGSEKAMALTNEAIRDSHWQSGFGSGLLLLSGLIVAWLWAQRSVRASERVAEDLLRKALLDRSAAAILLISPSRQVVNANAQFASIFLSPGQSLQSLSLRDIHIDDEHWEKLGVSYEAIKANGAQRLVYPFKDARGQVRWFDTHAVLQDPDDSESNVIWTWIDITSQHEADAALAIETLRLNTLLECFPGGVLIQDAHDNIVFVNAQWPQLLDLNIPATRLQGMHDSEFRASVGPRVASWLRSHRTGRSPESRRSHEVITEAGLHLEIDHVEIRQDRDYLGSVWLVRDITKRKLHELELARLASTDTLTTLPNRRSFMERLSDAHNDALADPKVTSIVMILDIDRFKRVNDTYGHDVGDIVLQNIAHEMKRVMRRSDVPGRLGGEEFAILLPRTDVQNGMEIAERVRRNIEHSKVKVEGHLIQVTISIGVAVVSAEHSPDVALRQADQALYTAKEAGRNRVCLWKEPEKIL